ncbi:uncharacterized protein A4U43_UnF4050 [Asparagus officinalis]|uniref:IBH1-like N-terminal domain-containing protein n=1 Tax=Asparagus officinalis TaxID=4686 RepID=A0A1R3L6Y3_ASPOF|nr:transcription factor IBH1-like [Asparagus officinalis]ONK55388.1 uncharacterized protein A4U43_UnF4050 [Asparagus officinalis]
MQATNKFNKSFLKLMINGLKLDGVHSKSMSIQERKRAIKLSADAAMALARGHTKWSNALITNLSKQEKHTTDNNAFDHEKNVAPINKWKIPTSKKILGKSLRYRSRKKNADASIVARRIVKKRTQVLKRIIPGGESLNSLSLLGETLDYVIHLRAQVNLMQCLANALGASTLKPRKSIHCKKELDQGGGYFLERMK